MNFKNIMIIFIMLSLMSVTFADADSNAEQAPVEILDIEILDLDSISEDTDIVPAEIVGVTASPISPSNQDKYSVVVEVRGIFDSLYYEIKDSKETIVSDNLLVKDEYFKCLSDSIKGKPCKITFSNGVSSLLDGDITISLELREDKVPIFKEKIITTFKDTEKPEIRRVNAPSINSENVDKYSLTIETNETDYSVDLTIGNTPKNLLQFNSINNLNLSSLKDGTLRLTLVIIDKAGNRSKPYIGIINKDTISPKLVLEKTEFFHNRSDITITGNVTDVLNETITSWININKERHDCEVVYSVIHYPDAVYSLNKISCVLKDIKDGNYITEIFVQDAQLNKNTIPITIIIDTTEVSLELNDENRNVKKEIKTIEGEIKVKKEAIVSFIASLKPTNSNSFTSLRYIPEIKDENKFIIDINKPVSGQALLPLKDEEYILRIYLKDIYGNIIRKEQIIIIDSTVPEVTINSLSTTDRSPIITGTIKDNTETEVTVLINDVNYKAEVNGENWSVLVNETLAIGEHNIKVTAIDEAYNKTETESVSLTINSTGGGGTRIYPATPAPVVPETTPEEPEETTPVEPQPEQNSNTGGEVITPQEEIEPVEETPELIETPVETPTPSDLTGFAGFASSPGGVATIIGGALVVIGAIGYFFFLRPR